MLPCRRACGPQLWAEVMPDLSAAMDEKTGFNSFQNESWPSDNCTAIHVAMLGKTFDYKGNTLTERFGNTALTDVMGGGPWSLMVSRRSR